MARIMQAVRDYGPRVVHNQTAQVEQLASWIEARTSLNKSEIVGVLTEVNEAITFFNNMGTPVKFPGVGTFRPSINRHGQFKINFRADPSLKKSINAEGAYTGDVLRMKNAGLSNEEYKALWDADHPDDPLEF
jgi:hypothetical protein